MGLQPGENYKIFLRLDNHAQSVKMCKMDNINGINEIKNIITVSTNITA